MHQRRMGRFERGVIIPEKPEEFDEGEVVEIPARDVALSPELEAEIAEGLAEIERGETVDAFEFLKQLRARDNDPNRSTDH